MDGGTAPLEMDGGTAPGAEWTGTHTITVYHTAAHVDTPQPAPNPAQSPLQYSLGGTIWNTHTRKLVNQSHGHFMMLQELAVQEQAQGGSISAKTLLDSSRLYRAALHECVQGLRTEHQDLVLLYAHLELAWHLCEVLFIEILHAGCLIQQLLEWVVYNARLDGGQLEEVQATPSPERHPEYWNMMYRLVMRGQLSEASSLLMHHSRAHTNPTVFASMKEVLVTAPMIAKTSGHSHTELQRRWANWRKEVRARLDSGEYLPFQELQLLAKMMCGTEEVFNSQEVVQCCETWYELMVGKLLYTDPLVSNQDYELSYCADWSRKTWQAVRMEELGDIDKLLDAAFRHDFMQIIELSSSKLRDWWFVAHLANILQHKGILTQQRLESAPQLCEFLLVEYSTGLVTFQSLWQVAMDYLSHCPTHGTHHMELLVERIPLNTEKKANKVIHLCQRYHLKEKAKGVCRVLAMKAYKNKRFGASLTWSLKGKDSSFAAFLVEEYMEKFDSLGEFMDLDLLDNLGDAMLLNDKLLFLAKYREYHLLHEKQELVDAGGLLVALLVSDSVPRRFLSTLLKDALGLLHEPLLVFSSAQTYTLSHFVLQLSSSADTAERTPFVKKIEEELVSLLRLALVKNLSRALMEESS